jgi:oxygen-independent coproporphyrinogen-3 oxidase
MNNRPLGIYAHIPFCIKKCLYCDFNSYSGILDIAGDYVKAVLKEITLRSQLVRDRRVASVYFGGGTPTVIDTRSISCLISAVKQNFNVLPTAEFTIEANPGTVSENSLNQLRKAGVNRLSIGLQAWQDRLLAKLGRIHCKEDFVTTYKAARQSGFDNINVDLMFGLPTQTVEEWEETITSVIELGPEHISAYSLEIGEDTPFYRMLKIGELSLPDESSERDMYQKALDLLGRSGYVHYEISNFSLAGKECRHNLLYWQAQDYLGLGAGAHSYINAVRFSNRTDPDSYIRKINSGILPTYETHVQTLKDEVSEYMFMGLRLLKGVSRDDFSERFNKGLDDIYGRHIKKLCDLGLLEDTGRHIRLTRLGLDFGNSVFEEFII